MKILALLSIAAMLITGCVPVRAAMVNASPLPLVPFPGIGGPKEEPKEEPDLEFVQVGPKFIARIRLTGRIGAEMADFLIKRLDRAAKQKVDGVLLDLNSEGGAMDSGFEISRAIESIPVPVVCVVDGSAQSMMFYVLQSCDVRLMTKRSYLMVHQPAARGQVPGSGNAVDWDNVARDLMVTTKAMAEHLARKMKVTPAQILARIPGARIWLMDWKDALKYGAVEGVVPTVDAVYADMTKGAELRIATLP